jgi:hypothetical protein
MLRKTLLAGAAVCALLPGFANAQAVVNQQASRGDAATFMASTPAPATACATINTTTVNGTVTITPPSGQYAYITGAYIDITANATGTTSAAVMTWAGLTNPNGSAPVYSLATIVPTAGANGTFRQIAETYSPPLKSAAPGTAVTLTPSAQIANTIVCPRVLGYFAP